MNIISFIVIIIANGKTPLTRTPQNLNFSEYI